MPSFDVNLYSWENFIKQAKKHTVLCKNVLENRGIPIYCHWDFVKLTLHVEKCKTF